MLNGANMQRRRTIYRDIKRLRKIDHIQNTIQNTNTIKYKYKNQYKKYSIKLYYSNENVKIIGSLEPMPINFILVPYLYGFFFSIFRVSLTTIRRTTQEKPVTSPTTKIDEQPSTSSMTTITGQHKAHWSLHQQRQEMNNQPLHL